MRRYGSAVTSISPETQPVHTGDLGSLVVMSWRSTSPTGDVPYVLACSLGDGANGPEATSKAIEQLLTGAGLPPGEGLVHATQRPSLPVGLLVVPGSAVLTVQHLKSQFVPPSTWLQAVGELGYAYLIFATRPWPEGAEPGDFETLSAFTSDEDVLASAAHVVLPARSLRS